MVKSGFRFFASCPAAARLSKWIFVGLVLAVSVSMTVMAPAAKKAARKSPLTLNPIPITITFNPPNDVPRTPPYFRTQNSFTYLLTTPQGSGTTYYWLDCPDKTTFAPFEGSTRKTFPYRVGLLTTGETRMVTIKAIRNITMGACPTTTIETWQGNADTKTDRQRTNALTYLCGSMQGLEDIAFDPHKPTVYPSPSLIEASQFLVQAGIQDFDCTVGIAMLLRNTAHANAENVVLVDVEKTSPEDPDPYTLLKSPNGKWPYLVKLNREKLVTFRIRAKKQVGSPVAVRLVAKQKAVNPVPGPETTIFLVPD